MSDRAWAKPEILVLAADRLPRMAFQRALQDQGYEPQVACDAAGALALADEHPFVLSVIDTHDTDLECAAEIANKLIVDHAAHVIVVHDSDAELPVFDLQSGRVHMLSHPFSMLEFISSVDDALSIGR